GEARLAARDADRRPRREPVRGPDRGQAEGPARERTARPGTRDLRCRGPLVAVEAVKTAVLKTPTQVLGVEHALPGELRVLRAAARSLTGEGRGLGAVIAAPAPTSVGGVACVPSVELDIS